MKSFTEDNGIATFMALPYPLPVYTQSLLKDSARRLVELRKTAEKTLLKVPKKKAIEDYNMAVIGFDQQEELLRTFIGVSVSRPVIRSIQVT